MKAALCKSLDGIDGVVLDEVPQPTPTRRQALVRVTACGLNFADTLMTRGTYQFKPELPFAPGAEIAGVVEAVGAGVTTVAPGDRVMAYVGWGGASETLAVDETALVGIPDGVPDSIAAGLSVTYGTAIHGLKMRARLKSGETVVVTGAAGGAGQAAVEIAHLMGARVIAVASSPDKLDIARSLGADDGILFPSTTLRDDVKALTDGKGADVVYDCIGGDAAEPLVRALAWQGRFLVVGFASGSIPRLPLNLLLLKGADVVGVFWGESVRRDPDGHRTDMRDVLQWVAAGRLKPRTHAIYPLARIKDALGVIERREATGKVVVTL
ncbi:MAG: NADPH:quinone oxidoreductase family protein [Hyphomicrobium sp.]